MYVADESCILVKGAILEIKGMAKVWELSKSRYAKSGIIHTIGSAPQGALVAKSLLDH